MALKFSSIRAQHAGKAKVRLHGVISRLTRARKSNMPRAATVANMNHFKQAGTERAQLNDANHEPVFNNDVEIMSGNVRYVLRTTVPSLQ